MAQSENTQILDSTKSSKSNVELLNDETDFAIRCPAETRIATQIGMAVFDRNLQFAALNQRFSDIDGRSIQYHIGRTSRQIVGNLSGQYDCAIRNVFAAGKCLSHVEIVGKMPQRIQPGRWIGNFFPLIDSDSTVIQVGVFIVEIANSPKLRCGFGRVTNLNPTNNATRSPIRDFLDDLARREESQNFAPFDHPSSVLSPRELEILRLLAQGEGNKEIAWSLNISVKTVESHRSRIMDKVGASSLVHLVHYAFKHHLVQIEY
jgi:DNA-binding CsgD family transcriptional regulator